ncbi:MAG: caspase family protein [Thiotrichaceae bacterium]|nr:caspase family protein [Thiotrichaceae bacterium]
MYKNVLYVIGLFFIIITLVSCDQERVKPLLFPAGNEALTPKSISFNTETINLYALIIGDTLAPDIGKSVDIDIENIKELVKNIEQNIDVKLTKKVLISKNFTYRKVKQAITATPQTDIILFYYGGHGRNDGNTQWPTFDFSKEQKTLDFLWVFEELKQKKNRLLIAIADACNNHSTQARMSYGFQRGYPKASNYEKIFLGYKGEFIAASASSGEYAYGTQDNGGLFTYQFLSNLKQELSSNNPSWDSLIKKSKQKIVFTDGFSNSYRQQPQFEGELSSIDYVESLPVNNSLSIKLIPSEFISIGENLKISIQNNSTFSGYLNLWDINSDGNINCIYPNNTSQETFISSSDSITIPNGRGFLVGEPLGANKLVAAISVNKSYHRCIKIMNNVQSKVKNSSISRIYKRLKQNLDSDSFPIFTAIDYSVTP